MKTKILWIGKNKEPFIKEGIKMFQKRLSRFTNLELVEIETRIKSKQKDDILKGEAEAIRKRLSTSDFVIFLDENGKEYGSRKLASELQNLMSRLQGNIVFVIGGAYGFSPALKKEANLLLSMSKLTFSHQLIRLIFMEQLYRAFCIINNHPYHND